MWQLWCTPQAEVSGDHLQVHQVGCMPHGACSTLPPWQEREGPCARSWHVEGNPSRLNSCWGLGVPLAVHCVQRWLRKRLQGQADRAAWCLANSGGLLMVPEVDARSLECVLPFPLVGTECGKQGSSQDRTWAGMGHWEVWMRPGGALLQLGHGIWPACCTTSHFCTTGSPPSFSKGGGWQLSPRLLWPHHSCGCHLSLNAFTCWWRFAMEVCISMWPSSALLITSAIALSECSTISFILDSISSRIFLPSDLVVRWWHTECDCKWSSLSFHLLRWCALFRL